MKRAVFVAALPVVGCEGIPTVAESLKETVATEGPEVARQAEAAVRGILEGNYFAVVPLVVAVAAAAGAFGYRLFLKRKARSGGK